MRQTVSLFLLIAWVSVEAVAQPSPSYDVVVRNGGVMDPESGRDERADVAIRGNKIVAIGNDLGAGTRELDARGLVVAPGFIDILASEPRHLHAHLHKIKDGVTTSLGMHGGPIDVDAYRRSFEESGALVNYAATVGGSSAFNRGLGSES